MCQSINLFMIYPFVVLFSNDYTKIKNKYENVNYNESDEF